VLRASEGFVRILIRRPHAYEFVQRYALREAEPVSADESGVVFVDGGRAPIPGLYVLDADGRVLASVPLLDSRAKEALLRALEGTRPR
jgi:hypothetical protein